MGASRIFGSVASRLSTRSPRRLRSLHLHKDLRDLVDRVEELPGVEDEGDERAQREPFLNNRSSSHTK